MTMPLDRETVLRLAREAVNSGDGSELSGDAIERFAQLVFLEAASSPMSGDRRMAFCPACFVEVTAEQANQQTLDARRYRWLRDVSVPPHNFYISVPDEFHGIRYSAPEVDAYIDAAMKGTT
jgi:hypothetical protein